MLSARLSQPPNLVAIDLGAESCRVSLLQWNGDLPQIDLIYRCSNGPVARGHSLHWNFDDLLKNVRIGLGLCAERTIARIASIGVDGWAVDYVRLNRDGIPIGEPFCYRDERTLASEAEIKETCPAEFLYGQTGVQPLRINTLYQLIADRHAGVPPHYRWVNLPEYLLSQLGGRLVAEHSNAAHTGLLDLRSNAWNKDVFECAGLDLQAAPELVPTGTDIGSVGEELRALGPFTGTRLIAPACHDTASAVAGIPAVEDHWAYISSGTWSLPGSLLDQPVASDEARSAGFTNLRAAGDQYCFHKNVNGMWLLKQVQMQLCPDGSAWSMPELIAAAEKVPSSPGQLNVDHPALLLPGDLASLINGQLRAQGMAAIPEDAASLPAFASLIFRSLAHRYGEVLHDVVRLTGRRLERIYVVGGGSLNPLLNRLTANATGLPLSCGVVESSTIGNFAVQLTALEGAQNARDRIRHWASVLASSAEC
ncbi:MAG: FGGY family carbohydrate kinase [Acidobacteriaceae bacterium]